MTAIATAARVPLSISRRYAAGVTFVVLGLIDIALLGLFSHHGDAIFALSLPGSGRQLPSIHAPAALTCFVAGGISIALGLLRLTAEISRRVKRLTIAIVLLSFLVAVLCWSGSATTTPLNVVSLLQGSLEASIPLILGALSGLLCERSGVINIAIEGQFLVAAFFGAMVGSATGNLWLGLIAGAIAGGVIGLILAVFTITYKADQIIVGVVLDAFALGLTTFFLLSILVPNQTKLNSPSVFGPIPIPLLDKIPIVGPLLFNQNIMVYLTVIILIAVQVALFQTRWGLRVRAVGEHPRAAETVGIKVLRVRYRNVILGGLVAGIGGASFTIGSTGQFAHNMTAGLGYIALAAMIFGRWRPFGALGAALLFGFSDALQFTLSVLNVPIPSAFLSMFPYLATILAVAGLVGRVMPPAADGQPYSRE